MSDQLRIGVVGAGATGGYLAARLADSGVAVTLLARGRSLEAIRREGIRIEGPDGKALCARPAQVVAAGDKIDPVDVALFCVKSYDTEDAAAVTGPLLGSGGRVLCTQNGIENETVLIRRFGPERVMPGVFYIGAERIGPNVIRCSAPPRLVFGPAHESNRALARSVKTIFDGLGIQCTIEEDILVAKWQKFLFNCGLNPLTALTRKKLGALLASLKGRELFEALVDEAIAVAKAHGAPLPADVRNRVMEVAGRMDISSSMAEDLAGGRPIELEAFSGLVCRLGRLHGISVPVTHVIYDLLASIDPAASKAST
jgi:2-dehydropantoate 2-reductase